MPEAVLLSSLSEVRGVASPNVPSQVPVINFTLASDSFRGAICTERLPAPGRATVAAVS